MRRSFVPLAVAATLLVLLAALGTLQYRWLGEVSAAERERLRATLRTRAGDFSRDFDREITRAYMAFRTQTEVSSSNAASVLADAYARAQADSSVGGIVKSVYFLETDADRLGALRQLDPPTRTLSPVDWPTELDVWRRRMTLPVPPMLGLPPVLMGDAIDARIPALVVSLPAVKRIESSDGRVAIVHDSNLAMRVAILQLDRDRLQQLIDALVARHFGTAEGSEYYVSVVTRDASPQVMYASTAGAVSAGNADVATGLFDLRLDELRTFTAKVPPPSNRTGATGAVPEIKDRVAVTIVRRTDAGDAARVLMTGGDGQGAWQVLVRGKAGSLESLVARSRTRNLAVSLGILGLLGASVVFVIGSAQRQQRLARQQMEFVAAVSHELRTPLAVIRSAGENLADGVVADAEQVKKYGSLVRTEGRRLSDMVERVMEFAGMTSSAPVRTRDDVDIAQVVADAVSGVAADAHERGVVVAVRGESGLPPIVGDPDALRSAVQNVIANAVKYSPAGAGVAVVDVQTDLDGGRVRLIVSDRGIGIDAADLPHVFKPFYRGRRAVEAQIRGTGVGLSVVRHVVDAHQGQISIDSRAGEGTRVVVTFPAAVRRDGYVGDRAAARATT